MANTIKHVDQNLAATLQHTPNTLSLTNSMQKDFSIIETDTVNYQGNNKIPTPSISLTPSSENAKTTTFQQAKIQDSSNHTPEPLTLNGKPTTHKQTSPPPQSSFNPQCRRTTNHFPGGTGPNGTWHLLQHHVEWERDSDRDPQLSLSRATDLRRDTVVNEQLYKSSLAEQCSPSNCTKPTTNCISDFDGGMESTPHTLFQSKTLYH